LKHFEQDSELADAMRALLAGDDVKIELVERLEAAGLVNYDAQGQYHPACRLYAEFFEHML